MVPVAASHRRAGLRWAARTTISLVGTDLGIRVLGRVRATIGPAVADLRVVPGSSGGTVLRLPPVGEARIASHRGTVGLRATLVGVDRAAARTLVAGLQSAADPRSALADAGLAAGVRADAERAGLILAARSVVGGLAGAGVLNLLLFRRPRNLAGSSAVAALAIGAAGALALSTVRTDSWKDARLSGLLTEAPKVIGRVQDIPAQFDRYRRQLGEIVASVTGVLGSLSSLPGGPPTGAIRVVHVSDIHNNPLAFDVIAALVRQYAAHAVIDTGDLGDWGTPAEAKVFGVIEKLPVPYVFCKGNHDSDRTAALVGRLDNVSVCDGPEPVVVAGLRIVGVADPRFTPDKTSGGDQLSEEARTAAGTAYAAAVRALPPADGRPVDIALAHDPVMAAPLAGVVPLVLSGHTHRREQRREAGTLFLTEGTSGGAGLRGVRGHPPDSLAFSVLHFDSATGDLHTVDAITVGGLGQTEVSLVRRPAAELGAPREP